MTLLVPAYITKYALTAGIQQREGEVVNGRLHTMNDLGQFQGFGPREFYLVRERAIIDAERRRREKIESLKKQIKHLEGLKFE